MLLGAGAFKPHAGFGFVLARCGGSRILCGCRAGWLGGRQRPGRWKVKKGPTGDRPIHPALPGTGRRSESGSDPLSSVAFAVLGFRRAMMMASGGHVGDFVSHEQLVWVN